MKFHLVSFRMCNDKTLFVNVDKSKRSVAWACANVNKNTPGELNRTQWTHFKVKPATEAISDLEANIGKLITYEALRETIAQMVEDKGPYQYEIAKEGITGTSEIVSYHFSKNYLDQKICISHFSAIEKLILVVVKKQLRAQVEFPQSARAVFINEKMLPRWECGVFKWTPQATMKMFLDCMDSLLKKSVVLDLKISIQRFEDQKDNLQVYIEFWAKVIPNAAIGKTQGAGLYCSKYPKITTE